MGDELEPAAHMSNASFAHSCSFSTKCPQPGGMRMTPRVYCRMMWTFWRHAKAMPSGMGPIHLLMVSISSGDSRTAPAAKSCLVLLWSRVHCRASPTNFGCTRHHVARGC